MSRHPAVPLALLGVAAAAWASPPELTRYDLLWTTPSGDASGSMPIGNGVVGANVWVDRDGDLLLLLSRTDAWSETDRLLKLGRVRVHLEPSPFVAGSFRQELRLSEGKIVVSATTPLGEARVQVYVLPLTDQVRVDGNSAGPFKITATLEDWRRAKKTFENDEELRSSWTMHSAPAEVRREIVWESPDVVAAGGEGGRSGVLWYHRNEHSVVPFTLEHQGLAAVKDRFPDPLIHRTFGGFMEGSPGSGLVPVEGRPGVLATAETTGWFGLRITTHAAQTDTAEAWASQVRALGTPEAGPDQGMQQTAAWWSAFWDRSWVFVEGDGQGARPVPQNRRPLRIGADSGGGNVFRGAMRRAQVFDAVPVAASAPSEPHQLIAGFDLPACLVAWSPSAGKDPDRFALFRASGRLSVYGDENPQPFDQAREGETTFDGGHLELVRSGELSLPRGFTLSADIKPAPDLGSARIFDKMTAGGSDGFIFDTHPGDALRLIVGDLTISAPGVLKRNEWQHVAATYDATTGRGVIYHNGKAVATGGPGGGKWSDATPPSRVTQAYVLQRWVQACGGGPREGSRTPADYPIKFNGSIFTVESAWTQGQKFDPDWRKWGGCYWWQNTRLPYYPMLASGDFEMMEPLFRLYERAVPGAKARAGLYHGADGVYWPETMTSFGTYGNGDYGWDRAGAKPGDIHCPWWQYAWNQSLELTQLMLDRAAYTGDERFLAERAIPMARETLKYFESRFMHDGVMRISPTQAVETYWHDVVDDAPVVGGLHTVCDQLLALPARVGSAEDRALWTRVRAATPPLPVWEQHGVQMAAPAAKFKNQRTNCETPELYPLWPFNEYGLGKPGLELARAAYLARVDKSTVGWTQDGLFAARLGLTPDAQANLLAKVRNSHPAHRFPAMWGPNFDWLPDQDHGSNLLLGTQLMLLQADPVSGTLRLLPAWPREWGVSFKLHAPGRTTVECVYKGGKIERLIVTPEARRKDLVLPDGLTAP